MKKILVPTDFSTPSRASYAFALDLAAAIQGEIFVIHMTGLPVIGESFYDIQPPPFNPALVSELKNQTIQVYEEMAQINTAGIPSHFTPIINDNIVNGVLTFVGENKIDCIIMSTHGASNLGEFFIGSTAERISRLSPVPVIAIPKAISFQSIKDIVFPTTLDLDQHDLVTQVSELQSICHATLHVLLINTPVHFHSDAESKFLLNQFAKTYNLHNFTLNYRNHQHERDGIVSFQQEIKGDLIAMATHGRRGLARFINGSITESVLNNIDQPIWTYCISHK